ncbi:hypothetical protein GQ42DRAFT_156323 [Ramicandelaber brevisporus]|nr:hypothetical protein GQ42DRAFT_156323 [Ramicandelaber brevisporus]
MTVSASNSDEQQVSQQLQHERSTLPLVHLPYELAEETSLYFKPKEAARVLSVSRSFYNLLIPRVCYELESCCRYRALSDFEEWFKTYGQYVRLVDPLLPEIRHIAANLDWLPFVNKATYLRSFLHADSPLNDITREDAPLAIWSKKVSETMGRSGGQSSAIMVMLWFPPITGQIWYI